MYYKTEQELINRLESFEYWDDVVLVPRQSDSKWIDQILPYVNAENYVLKNRKKFEHKHAHKFFGEFVNLPSTPSIELNQFSNQVAAIEYVGEVVKSMFEHGYDWTWYTLESNGELYSQQSVLNLFVGKMLHYEFEEVLVEDSLFDDAPPQLETILRSITEANTWLCLLYFDKGVISETAPSYTETEDYLI